MSLTAVLLAGGESRRMGRDKATLEWRGQPLWKWQLEKLNALQPQQIFVSARSELPWIPAEVNLVVDAEPSHGPLSGLAAALAAAKTEHVIALAVDMPFMTVEQLRLLFYSAAPDIGTIPMINGQAEPLSAIYPATARREFSRALQGADFSLQPVVRRLIASGFLREFPVRPEMRSLYRSINELSDLD